jgi:superfamily I DNA/RNA helicase
MDKRLLKIIADEVINYKKSYGLIDFTDMIDKFIVSGLCPKYDVAFVDEAQDLSPIQWKMFNIIKENSKYVILAGDDDQAIYGWAGADVKKFQQEISKKDIILPQSYRVPQNVQHIADKILKLIPEDRRVQKNWKAREEQGTVNYVYSLEDVPIDGGNWLVLARYNDKLNRLKPFLKERGIYFEYKDRKSYKVTLFRTILNYIRWQKGEDLSLAEVRGVLEYSPLLIMDEPTEEKMYDLEELGFDKKAPWYDVFTSDYEECLYIREMLSKGEELRKDPRVKLSTIHSAKGGEADNVLLILDNTKTIRDAVEKSSDKQDEEHRVWYVGVTRTKQNLYIMAAKKEDQGYDIESLG